jgi:spore maturation protein CgeB
MKILFLDWKSLGNEDIVSAAEYLNNNGYNIELGLYPFDNHIEDDDKEALETIKKDIKNEAPDFVMSFNYFPIVSKACNELGVKYAAWVYDNPAVRLFSYTLINNCNYVFVFDSQMYETFAVQGFKNVYYLPMAAAVRRYDNLPENPEKDKRLSGKISFVGHLYTESHNYFDRLEGKVSDYTKGYLQGLMRSQMEIQGMNIIDKSIPESVMKEMIDALGIKPGYDSVASYEYLYSNYVINRKITSLERCEILREIGEIYPVELYTSNTEFGGKGINNHGEVDYYLSMPYVFKNSDINLNISLRSIQRGIPLRAMDIMGCGGFLLTNYQEDMLQFFVPGEDYVYYDSRADLMDKLDYYLTHEDERKAIAESGYRKVAADHTYEQRLLEIIDTVCGSQSVTGEKHI